MNQPASNEISFEHMLQFLHCSMSYLFSKNNSRSTDLENSREEDHAGTSHKV